MKGWQDEIADRGGNVHRLIESITAVVPAKAGDPYPPSQ